MKHLMLVVALICLESTAKASPYFRPIDLSHPAPILGALLAPEDLKQSEATVLHPIFTHSPKDGCLMPSIVCEDWTPFAVGGTMNAGKISFTVGPVANVLPWMQAGARALVPASWSGTRAVLESNSDPAVTFSAGPMWQYRQATNRGYFRIFTGLALHF